MDFLPKSLRELIHEFSKLPGIGPKTAERLTFYLLRSHRPLHKSLGDALLGLKDGIVFCEVCCNLTHISPCSICTDPSRDASIICVVEEALDALAIEKTHEYKGMYHILHGAISPIDGVGPDDLTISHLKTRLEHLDSPVKEIILATNPNMVGEATAMYIQKFLASFDLTLTRIACGIPMGGDLEYADKITLKNALEGRQRY